jgi:hypothetical protein
VSADWKSAIQQAGSLRYFGCGFAARKKEPGKTVPGLSYIPKLNWK